MLDVAERAHPRIVSPSGAHRANDRFQDAAVFQGPPCVCDPLEQTMPMIELADRSAAQARQALAQIGRGRVADTILEDLLIGVTEAVTNALLHGRAPVTVRFWATPDRIVITVWITPGRLEALIPGRIQSRGSTEEVPRRAA